MTLPLSRGLMLIVGAVAVLVCAAAPAQDNPTAPDADARLLARRTPVVSVFESARDAVVNIAATQVIQFRSVSPMDRLFEDLFDLPPQARRSRALRQQSVGSGFVLHPDGYIVTNAHVVARTAERSVVFADGSTFEARIVAADPARDLALLKIDAPKPLPALPLGRSDDLLVGETVIAIGNPLGYQHTVTAGVVSALQRELPVSDDVTFTGLVQTDASINPGNSGGPLLNVLGELIGVTTAIRADAQNIGFAIPVDQLRAVLPEMLDAERRYRLRTGLRVEDRRGRCVVAAVEPDSPAAAAGLAPDDAITAVAGRPVHSAIDFHIALMGRAPGDVLPLQLTDGRAAALTLAPRPRPDGAKLLLHRVGLEAQPLSPEMARALGLRGAGVRGLLIDSVHRNGPAAAAGVERGDVLLQLDRYETATLDDVGQVLERLPPDTTLTADLLRVSGRTLYRIRTRLQLP